MLSSSGPANIAGNNVNTSTRILLAGKKSVLDQIDGTTATRLCTTYLNQGSDSLNGSPTATDDFSNVGRSNAQLDHRHSPTLNGGYADGVRVIHQTSRYKFDKLVHAASL